MGDDGHQAIGTALLESNSSNLGFISCDKFSMGPDDISLDLQSKNLNPADATLLAGVRLLGFVDERRKGHASEQRARMAGPDRHARASHSVVGAWVAVGEMISRSELPLDRLRTPH